MTLADGDYLVVQSKVVETLAADTGPGGLREPENPAVALIEAGLPDQPRQYALHELPALAVCVTGKHEAFEPNAKTIGKVFHLAFLVVCRAADRASADHAVKRIAARLEQLIRRQSAAAAQFGGLPAQLEDAEPALVAQVRETRFSAERAPGVNMDYTVTGEVFADLWIPAALDLP